MENQPQQPSRPWYRLGAQFRMQPPPQTKPTPQIGSTFFRALRPPIGIPSQPQTNPPPSNQKPAPSAQKAALVLSPPAPTIESPKASSLPPSQERQSLEPISSVSSTPLSRSPNSFSTLATPLAKALNSSGPVSPIRKTEEPVSSTVATVTKTVVSSSKTMSSSSLTSPIDTVKNRLPIPQESPKISKASSKTILELPKMKPSALPPSQLKPEPESKSLAVQQKNVLVQEHRERSEQFQSQHNKDYKKLNDHNGGVIRVITMAGENNGAYMKLGSSIKKDENKDTSHTFSRNTRISTSQAENDGDKSDGSSIHSDIGKSKRKEKTKLPMTAFVNSNVQTVNNSILFNTSCSLSDPGVHFVFPSKPVPGHGIHSHNQADA